MRYRYLIILLLLAGPAARASDSLKLSFSRNVVHYGDTLDFNCILPYFKESKLTSATLNLWIEDLEKKRRWKFRWPVVNGEVMGSLAIKESIPEGRYAFNFLVQRGYFRISGEVKEHDKKEPLINYMMVLKNKKGTYLDNTAVDEEGRFRLKSTLFEDSAYFIFTPVKKVKNNYLQIKIETPLDSAFVPVLHETAFITVGDEKNAIGKKNDSSQYSFQSGEQTDPAYLPGVTVVGKFKTKVQQYEDMYASGLFRSDNAMTFDGLESDQIAKYANLLLFLQTKVPGLMVKRGELGEEQAFWRDEPVEVYVDEFRLEGGDHTFVPPSDIAMIKVYRPPAMLSPFSGASGAIAIYTKKGPFATNARNKHNFIVKGYSSIDSVWK